MAAAKKDAGAYGVDDFVFVTDAAGVVQADAVPASWVGTDLLPQGWSKATAKEAKEADTNPVDAPDVAAAPVEPTPAKAAPAKAAPAKAGVVTTDKQA